MTVAKKCSEMWGYGEFGQLMTGPQLLAHMAQINIWLTDYNVQVRV